MAGNQKQLKQRINAVGNVKKITKAMQMIASSKVKAAERRMHLARMFAKDMLTICPAPSKEPEAPKNVLFVPICSDRGLCGSLNSNVTRAVRRSCDERLAAKDAFGVVAIGEKARAHLERGYRDNFCYVATDAGKSKPATFAEVALIAEHLLRQNFDEMHIYYNKFVNSLTNQLQVMRIPSLQRLLADRDAWKDFELEGVDEEILENLYEFRVATMLFGFMSENSCSEMSARVNSMSASSKNAAELVEKLLLEYNRTRQSQVTTELMEVISGALSVDEQINK